MSRLLTVDDMIIAVRSKLDEDNTVHLDNDRDIIPSLNRGQDAACSLLVQKYESPLLKYVTQTITAGTQEYDMPIDVYEDRIEKIEFYTGSEYIPINRISYRDASYYDTNSRMSAPIGYYIIGRKLRFVPIPDGSYNARIWYMKRPPKLTKTQGRITNITNIASHYFLVNEAGTGLSEDSDDLESFISIINGSTGEVRGTFQIQYIEDQKIRIKTSSNRSSIFGLSILSSISSSIISLDDYICLAEGSCIPFLSEPLYNYIVQFAVAELKGEKLNEENQTMIINLDRAEKRIEKSWIGREQDLIVKKKNRAWRKRR